jgi:hypothetical protein
MHPRPPDAIIDDAIRCPCTRRGQPWCVRCACLIELALARDVWLYEQATGQTWKVDMDRRAQEAWMATHRIGGLRGLGYTLLGHAVCVCAVAYYVCWVIPRTWWLHWTGRHGTPPQEDQRWSDTTREGKQ